MSSAPEKSRGREGGPSTLEDVARVAGVSRATASRVVTGTRPVTPEAFAAVTAALAETGYVPNQAARSLVTRRTGAVAVVVSSAGGGEDEDQAVGQILSDPFFGNILTAAVRALRKHDVHPLLMLADSQHAREQVIGFVGAGSVDGTLLVSTHNDDPMPAMLVSARRPVVAFARPVANMALSYVDVSGVDGGRLASAHLIELGRTVLGMIGVEGGLAMPSIADRALGFREDAARRGVAYVAQEDGDLTTEGGVLAARRLLAAHPGINGIFAVNDAMAAGVLDVLRESGREVPGDVAVVGFDDSSVALNTIPALTSIRQPMTAIAGHMADLLMRRIAEPGAAPMSVVVPPELVARAST
ncbi:LacI family DNA-binding transcriptional regulator [Demequina oxidasica]|uniref:LacI family DNA-binding transcriptional regulator n=1 Tax=Demequina oxidasica TaxID=676199 RepID=UPI00078515CF|nr:LacI family DNA-binding transcriptional regulator [Demequina oxidasica]